MTDISQQNHEAEAQPAVVPAATEAPTATGLRAQLFDRANKAKEQARSSLSGLASKTDGLRQQAATKVDEVKDAGMAKLQEKLDDFNSALPVLCEAGYALQGITLGMGIPPKLNADFSASEEASSANVERLLEEHANKPLTVGLLKALHNAWLMQTKIAIGGLKPTSLSVEVGLTPSVSLSFA
jgi:hypothetical protein